MANQWDVAGVMGAPDGVRNILFDTEDRLEETLNDPDMADELARSIFAMDNYVAEYGFIIDELVDSQTAMEQMVNHRTAMRELYLRGSPRRQMFDSEVASDIIVNSELAMNYLVAPADLPLDVYDDWVGDAMESENFRELSLTTTNSRQIYFSVENALNEIAVDREGLISQYVWGQFDAEDDFFDAVARFGYGLLQLEDELDNEIWEPIETWQDVSQPDDEDFDTDAFVDALDFPTTVLDKLYEHYDPRFKPIFETLEGLDLMTDDQAVTEWLMDTADRRSRTIVHPEADGTLWQKETSEEFWNTFGSFPISTSGVGITAEFTQVSGRLGDALGVQCDWESEGDADDFIGIGTTIDSDYADEFVFTQTRVDTSALGQLIIRVDGNREVVIRDDEHPSGWERQAISLTDYSGEVDIELGVAMAETGTTSDGTFTFGDITLETPDEEAE